MLNYFLQEDVHKLESDSNNSKSNEPEIKFK